MISKMIIFLLGVAVGLTVAMIMYVLFNDT